MLLKGKKPDQEFCGCVKSFFRTTIVLAIGILFTGCGILKGPLGDLKDEADDIAKIAATGFIAGLDTTQVDDLVNRLVAEAGTSLSSQLDSLSLDSLELELRTTLKSIIQENLEEVSSFLQDTTVLLPLETKLELVFRRMTRQIDASLGSAIPAALSGTNQKIVLQLRDDFLGKEFRLLVSSAVNQGVGDLAKSQELDSLLTKLGNFIDDTSTKLDDTTDGISNVVKAVALGIGGLLLTLSLLFFILWFRKRSQANKQRELLDNLTKAIDAIPNQQAYDKTIDYLHQKTSLANNKEQKVLLDEVISESAGEYPEKRRYNNYAQRILKELHQIDKDGSLREQFLADTEDEDFRKYLLNGVEG